MLWTKRHTSGSRNFYLHSRKGISESSTPLRHSFPRRSVLCMLPFFHEDGGTLPPAADPPRKFVFMRQKICLMALIEPVFKRSADNRTMSFQVITEETWFLVDEVEQLVTKALRWVISSLSCLLSASSPYPIFLQPQAHQGIARSSRPKGANNAGATTSSVQGADWQACEATG